MKKDNVVSFMEHKHKALVETLETLLEAAKAGRVSLFHAVYLEEGHARSALYASPSSLVLLRGMLAVASDQIQGKIAHGHSSVH